MNFMDILANVGIVVGIIVGLLVIGSAVTKVSRWLASRISRRAIHVKVGSPYELGVRIGPDQLAVGVTNNSHKAFMIREGFLRYSHGAWISKNRVIARDRVLGSANETDQLAHPVVIEPGETKYGARTLKVVAEWEAEHGALRDVLLVDADGRTHIFPIARQARRVLRR